MINQVDQPPDTRTRLVLAAMQLFWEKGYNSTSIADVLQTAKVNSGSVRFIPNPRKIWRPHPEGGSRQLQL